MPAGGCLPPPRHAPAAPAARAAPCTATAQTCVELGQEQLGKRVDACNTMQPACAVFLHLLAQPACTARRGTSSVVAQCNRQHCQCRLNFSKKQARAEAPCRLRASILCDHCHASCVACEGPSPPASRLPPAMTRPLPCWPPPGHCRCCAGPAGARRALPPGARNAADPGQQSRSSSALWAAGPWPDRNTHKLLTLSPQHTRSSEAWPAALGAAAGGCALAAAPGQPWLPVPRPAEWAGCWSLPRRRGKMEPAGALCASLQRPVGTAPAWRSGRRGKAGSSRMARRGE